MNETNILWLVGVDLLTSIYFSIIYSYYFAFSFIFGLLGLVVKDKECYSVTLYNVYIILDPLTKWMVLLWYVPEYYRFLVSIIILSVQSICKLLIVLHLYCKFPISSE